MSQTSAPAVAPADEQEVPEFGTMRQVAEGIHWVRIPLNSRAGSVNAWVLDEGNTWTLIDCGSDVEQAHTAWAQLLDGPLSAKPVGRIMLTHGHHDHIGMAGPLAERFGLTIYCSRTEWQTAILRAQEVPIWGTDEPERFLASHGCSSEQIVAYRRGVMAGGRQVSKLPPGFFRLKGGEEVEAAGRRWRLITGGGHSPECILFYDEANKLIISGDQVLPLTTPSITTDWTEPLADHMGEHFEFLEQIQAIPDDVTALPGHGPVHQGMAERARKIAEHHESRLSRFEDWAAEPMTALEFAAKLFPNAMAGLAGRLGFAVSLSHANHLALHGRLARNVGQDGVIRFVRP